MKSIKVALTDAEYDALSAWSHNELREPLRQAHFFIQQGLERRYRHADIAAADVLRVLYWLNSVPLVAPKEVTEAIKRLRERVNEFPKTTGA